MKEESISYKLAGVTDKINSLIVDLIIARELDIFDLFKIFEVFLVQ